MSDPHRRSDGVAAGPRVRLREARDADWPTIRRWLAEPAVIRWWGPKATTEAEVMLAMSSPNAIARIIEADGTAVGYAHAIDMSLLGETLPDQVPAGTWDIDLFIASPEHRGQGIGGIALEMVRREVFETTLAPAVVILVGVNNERAVRAYERAGFRWLSVLGASDGRNPRAPEWLLIAQRPARDRLI